MLELMVKNISKLSPFFACFIPCLSIALFTYINYINPPLNVLVGLIFVSNRQQTRAGQLNTKGVIVNQVYMKLAKK